MTVPRLSLVLGKGPTFWSFNELLNVASVLYLLQHDLFKIQKTLEEIIEHLESTAELFEMAFRLENLNDLEWILEGRRELTQVLTNLQSIDGILSQLLTILDEHDNQNGSGQRPGSTTKVQGLLNRFEKASNLLLEVKKYTIIFKKRLDVGINIKDIESVVVSILKEVTSCLLQAEKMEVAFKQQFDLEQLDVSIEKLVETLKSQSGNSHSSVVDEGINLGWSELQTAVKPVEVSLQFLPLRLDELDNMISHSFSDQSFLSEPLEMLDSIFHGLMDRWNELQLRLTAVKINVLLKRWRKTYGFLILGITKVCTELQLQVKGSSSSEKVDIGAKYRLCYTGIKIINKAFADGIIVDDAELIIQFNEELLVAWGALNDEISLGDVSLVVDNLAVMSPELTALRPYQISKRMSSPIPEVEHFHGESGGIGISLGLAISLFDSSKTPYSVVQKDKVKHFVVDKDTPSRKLQEQLLAADVSVDSVEDLDIVVGNRGTNHKELGKGIDDKEAIRKDETIKIDINASGDREPFNPSIQSTPRLHSLGEIRTPSSSLSASRRLGVVGHVEWSLSIPERIDLPDIGDWDEIEQLKQLWSYLRSHKRDESSKIPTKVYTMAPCSHVIKKCVKGSKIPVISLQHPVYSPSSLPTLQPPVVMVRGSDYVSRRVSSSSFEDHVFRKPSGRLHLVDQIPRTTSIPETPPLVADSPQWRSTSPDRPSSSIGSRYDEIHLIQPVSSPKRAWR